MANCAGVAPKARCLDPFAGAFCGVPPRPLSIPSFWRLLSPDVSTKKSLGSVSTPTPAKGTGSILVACALFGGSCFGADIDWRVLRGKAEGEDDGSSRRRGPTPRKRASLPVPPLAAEDGGRKTPFANFRQYERPRRRRRARGPPPRFRR
jgi:hypothetical protein